MTAQDFRHLALACPQAIEASHMGHPDFRVGGKIFATLGYPDEQWGVVKLTARDQLLFMAIDPDVFVPAKGAWGRQGSTQIRLRTARRAWVRKALDAAWRGVAPRRAVAASSRR